MKKLVFLTGAGISAESGIPTFRGAADGLWENYKVEDVATAYAIRDNPSLVYRFINELRNKYKDCQPNLAHKIIAELEKDYNVTVITQNIDNLHEKAGSTNIIHLHGDLSKVRAIDNKELLFDYPEEGVFPGDTINGYKVRPHIVLFWENVPNMEVASKELLDADICVVIGTSFSVHPASLLIQYVKYGNPIYYIDSNPVPLPEYPDVITIKAKATEGIKEILKILKNENN